MIPSRFNGYSRDGRRLYFIDMGGDAPPPPDYTPVAEASAESARIGAELGREQLAESRRQYDANMAIVKPVVDAQVETMRQTMEQGKDYYDYGKTFRPLEQEMLRTTTGTGEVDQRLQENQAISDLMNQGVDPSDRQKIVALMEQGADPAESARIVAEAAQDTAGLRQRAAGYESEARGDIATYTGGNRAIQDRYAADIGADVGTAVADARAGQASATNQAIRQALRYGLNVPANVAGVSSAQASQLASAANTTRDAATSRYRELIGQGIGLKREAFTTGQAAATDVANRAQSTNLMGRQLRLDDLNARVGAASAGRQMRAEDVDRQTSAFTTLRSMNQQDRATDWAKKLDVTGMARGLPSASQGAYGLSVNAGSAATQSQMAPGQALMSGINQSNATTMQGRQIAMQGLTGVLNSQTSAYNAGAAAEGQGTGALIGGAATIGAAFI